VTSAFADPTTPLQVLYNGVDYNFNNGTISLTLSGGVPVGGFDMYIFGNGGAVNVYQGANTYTSSTLGGGDVAHPGIGMVLLPAVAGPVTYTFLDMGNDEGLTYPDMSAWLQGSKQLISGFQLVTSGTVIPADNTGSVPEPGTWLLLGGSLLGLCVGGFRRFVRK